MPRPRTLNLLVAAAAATAAGYALQRLRGAPAEVFLTPPSQPTLRPTPVQRVEAPRPSGSGWTLPAEDGSCPPGHPVKAKLRSGIYHEPGMAAYDRTRADRCYATAEMAEADGLRRAKH